MGYQFLAGPTNELFCFVRFACLFPTQLCGVFGACESERHSIPSQFPAFQLRLKNDFGKSEIAVFAQKIERRVALRGHPTVSQFSATQILKIQMPSL